jgi:hypothetical protein
MSLSNAAENDLLLLLFNNTNWANLGDATGVRGSTTAGSFFIALHTADPGETGNQTTSEISYTGYARVAVARSSSGWTISGTAPTQAANASTITFGTMTGGAGGTVTFVTVGRDTSGTGEIFATIPVTNSVVVSLGNPIPSFASGQLVVTAD